MNLINFSIPQRQSIKGIVIMFFDTVQKFIRAFWAFIIILLLRLEAEKYLIAFAILLAIIVVLVVIAFLQYRNFTFYLDQDNQEFVVKKGVISKEQLVIQLDRIQQVNINQTVIQKLINVYSVDIDTAGSSKKEVSIRAVEKEFALLLKDELITKKKSSTIEVKPIEDQNSIFRISFSTLFKVGLTSNYGRSIALLIGFFAAAYNGIQDLQMVTKIDENQFENYYEKGLGFLVISILIALLFVSIIVINIVRTIIKHYNFELKNTSNNLTISQGLFARKNTILNPLKVQIISITQNYFQKKLNFSDVNLKQITNNSDANDNSKSDIIIPGCAKEEYEHLLKLINSSITDTFIELRPNWRFLLFPTMIKILISLLIFVSYNTFKVNEHYEFLSFLVSYWIVMLFVSIARYKNYKLKASESQIIKTSGFWDITNEIIEIHKIQSLSIKQYFWHKNSNLGHLKIYTAAGTISFKFGNFIQLQRLVNSWLINIESSHKTWM
jgi:putative membrane protein